MFLDCVPRGPVSHPGPVRAAPAGPRVMKRIENWTQDPQSTSLKHFSITAVSRKRGGKQHSKVVKKPQRRLPVGRSGRADVTGGPVPSWQGFNSSFVSGEERRDTVFCSSLLLLESFSSSHVISADVNKSAGGGVLIKKKVQFYSPTHQAELE